MTRKHSILVLEDDPNLRELLLDLLESDGYAVRGAASPEEAIAAAKNQKFHLMISDIRMAGGTDGLGAVARIKREIQPELFVLVMTGYADEDAPDRAMDSEVDGYLYKNDFNARLLSVAVEGILRQREQKGFFRSLFEPIVSASRRYLEAQEQARFDAARHKLDEARLSCYRRYVVAVQSRQMLLGAALEVWDNLAILESYYPKLSRPQDMGTLYQKYREIQASFSRKTWSPTTSHQTRRPGQVERKAFQGLFDRICAGEIRATELQMAETVRTMSPEERRKDAKFEELFERFWMPLPARLESTCS